MANKIVLKKSSVNGRVPSTSDLDYGELALNYTDGKLYFKNSSNVINAFKVNNDLSTVLDRKLYTVSSAGTNTFAVDYEVGFVDVYVNGVKLNSSEFTATNGLNVTITALVVGDEVQLTGFRAFTYGDISTRYIRQTYTALAGQNVFDIEYSLSNGGATAYVQVFVNGVLLDTSEYTATSGTAIVLTTAASAGDIVECIGLNDFQIFDLLTSGTGLSYDNNTGTITLNSATAATANTIALRDGSGNLTANTFTGALSGNATTATTLQTARNINGTSFNGSADISFGTDSVSEGSTNLYFTNTRAFDAISGTSPTLGTVTLTGELRGPASFVIDPSAVGDNTGVVVIKGDLQVDGTTTTINSTTLTVDDKNIVLASGAADNSVADGAGITIDGANATLTYMSSGDAFAFNKTLRITDSTNTLQMGQWDNVTNRIESVGRGLFLTTYSGSIQLGISNTADLTITANRKVGIGTDNPNRTLHVKSPNGDQGIAAFEAQYSGLAIQDNSGGNGNVEIVGYKQTSQTYHDVLLRGSTGGLLVKNDGTGVDIKSAGALMMSGEIAINSNRTFYSTAGPTSGYRLHINSGITASNNHVNFFTSQTDGWKFMPNGDGTDSTSPAFVVQLDGTLVNYESMQFANATSGDLHLDVEPGTRTLRTRNWNSASPNINVTAIKTGTFISQTAKNTAGLEITQVEQSSSFGDSVFLDFKMYNEVTPTPQFSGNPAARIGAYLEGSNNGYGLDIYTRANAGSLNKVARFNRDGQFIIGPASVRPTTIQSGAIYLQGESGGWSVPYGFKNASGTYVGGFGMLGETNSVSNFWVGPDWNNNYMTWDSSAIKSNRPHVSQNGYHWLQKELPQFSFGAGGVTDEYLVLAKIFDNAGNVASSGVMGEIIAARGGTSTGNSSCKTRIHVTCAYNNNYCGEFTTTGSRDFYKISIITIDGVKYYAAKAREGGGDSHLGISFSGWIITDNASNLLTRVRTSDAGVAFVSDVFYPTQARTTSDNTLRLETNGSDRLVIASNGYVGIGNPDPKSILHISNGHGAGSSGILNLTPNGSGGSASLIVAGNNDSGGTPGPNVIAFANRTITFGGGDSFTSNTGGTITAWANVSASGLAIGSGFSTATAKLAVYGAVGDNNSSDATFLVSCASSNDWGQIIDKGASADYGLDIRVAPSAAYGFRVNSNFRVNGSGEVFSTNSYASGDVIIRGTDAAPRGLFIQEWDGATTYGGGISYDSVADQLYLFTRSASSTDLKALTISRGSNNVTILGTLTEASTRRIKKNIRPITNALEVVNKLQGVIYDKIDGSQKDEPGLIAEDTLDAIANLVVFDDDGQPAGVKYTKTVAYLIEAVKELTAKVNALENK